MELPEISVGGIQTSKPSDANRLQIIADAGADWIHYTALQWDRIEPVRSNPPEFRWEFAEEEGMKLAFEKGLTLIANVSYTPSWAQKRLGYACGPIKEDALQRFGIFMQEAVLRYSKPPYNVKYWELGNEPDVLHSQVEPRSGFGCWGDASDPYYGGGYYAQMLRVVYPYIKAADPEAQVLIGGLLFGCNPDIPWQRSDGSFVDCSASRFFEGIFLNGGGPFFDGVSYHAYDYYYQAFAKYGHDGWQSTYSAPGPVLIAKTNFVREILDRYGFPDKSFHVTEVALLCGSTGKESQCLTDDFKLTKSYYVAYVYTAARAMGVDSLMWYELNGWRGSELVRGNLEPLPAYQSFQFISDLLSKAAYIRSLGIPGTSSYEFVLTDTNQRLWVLWAMEAQELPLILPQNPEAIYNVFGEKDAGVDTIVLSPAPIYVLWQPGIQVESAVSH